MLAAELKKYSAEVRPAHEHAPPIPPRAPRSQPPRTRPPSAFVIPGPTSPNPNPNPNQQQQQQSTTQTGSNPDACNDAMRGLRIGSGGGCSSMAQSLPSHSHMAMHAGAPPRKPRVHPSPAPSFAGVPLMALRRVDNVWSLKPTPPHPAWAVCIQGVGPEHGWRTGTREGACP